MNPHIPNAPSASTDFVTFTVGGQHFGLKAVDVRDVLRSPRITAIPLTRRDVAGVINLRGHIVTAIDVRRRLGLPDRDGTATTMSIVVERQTEQFCLIADSVGDVLPIHADGIEPTPASVDDRWSALANGIHKLDDALVVLLDLTRLLELPQ